MIVLPARPKGDLPGVSFRQARDYRWGRRGYGVLWLVIHSAECAETDTAAEALQSYALKPDYPSSWHYACDRNSTTQSVLERDTAFHAPPVSDVSIGIELAGRAKQLASDWADAYSAEMISSQLVPLAAGICARRGIPVREVDDEQLAGGWETAKQLQARKADAEEWGGLRVFAGGIVTHARIARVFKSKTAHWDPGPHFPMAALLERMKAVAA